MGSIWRTATIGSGMRNLRCKFAGITLGLALFSGMLVSPADATEVDLGSPTTMAELLDSPEYQTWHADVLRLYRAFFDRAPDVPGAKYWIGIYEHGVSLDDIAWGFSNSPEFRSTYGESLSNSQFLTIVYANVLGRAPDPSGFQYWLNQMDLGLSQSGVVRWVVANAEFIGRHPFTGTATPIEDFLLSPNQVTGLDTVYQLDHTPVLRPVQMRSACDASRVLPKNAFGVGYGINNNAEFTEYGYKFSTEDAAKAYIANVRNIATLCENTPYGPFTMTVSSLPSDGYGDEAVAHHFVVSSPDYEDYHWHDIYIRIGRLVLALDITAGLSVPTSNIFDYATDAVTQANSVGN